MNKPPQTWIEKPLEAWVDESTVYNYSGNPESSTPLIRPQLDLRQVSPRDPGLSFRVPRPDANVRPSPHRALEFLHRQESSSGAQRPELIQRGPRYPSWVDAVHGRVPTSPPRFRSVGTQHL